MGRANGSPTCASRVGHWLANGIVEGPHRRTHGCGVDVHFHHEPRIWPPLKTGLPMFPRIAVGMRVAQHPSARTRWTYPRQIVNPVPTAFGEVPSWLSACLEGANEKVWPCRRASLNRGESTRLRPPLTSGRSPDSRQGLQARSFSSRNAPQAPRRDRILAFHLYSRFFRKCRREVPAVFASPA